MSEKLTTEEMIEEYLRNGGEIVKLRYASKRDQDKASRRWHHKDKALSGSDRSKEFLRKEDEKQSMKIFSKTDQWRQ
tara:strand:+ start:1851 stop:2081 length:231 start_codon:yes stop_codon:yes gene_type:complete